jgi:Trk-type K+ transport system membrane component
MKISSKIFMEKLSSVQIIVLFYIIAVGISTLLLLLPVALNPGEELSFIDALFTAASAVSVTGLSTISIAEKFSLTGMFIFIFILQFGGIGIMTLGTFIWLLMGKKIGLRERKLIMADQNQSTLSGLVQLMRQILFLIILIEIVGSFVLGAYLLRYYPDWQDAFLHGFFMSVSATTNGGFDITGSSLLPYAGDYFVQLVNIILIILGAIGFPVLIEVRHFLFRKEDTLFRFSLFTKITSTTFLLLVVFGTLLIILFEYNSFFSGKSWHESFFYAFFQSVSSRSGGLSTMNVSEFTTPTLLILCILMFIGASPSSVGGGIRTTSLAIMMLSIYNYAKGKDTIKVFKKEILQEDILKSYIVITTAIMICSAAVITIAVLEPSIGLMPILFEVCSAFGTTGLSMGITADLSIASKLVIILVMFIGRIGIFSFLFIIRGNPIKEKFHYPKERIIIG